MKKVLIFIVVFTLVFVGANYNGIQDGIVNEDSRVEITGESSGTVVSSQSGLVVHSEDGTVKNRLTRYNTAFDVDKLSDDRVLVVVQNETNLCNACAENIIIEWNVRTNAVTHLYVENTYRTWPAINDILKPNVNKWHDVDKIGENRYIIADIGKDRVRIVNSTSGRTEWTWLAKQSFDPVTSGGEYPYDWTHLNDVDVTENGYMVSLRNHDQIVFLNKTTGAVKSNLTLGSDDDYSVLFEQHNADYFGQGSVIVADSENNQVKEFRRVNSSWKESWVLKNTTWVRDADRLSNGNTLITSTRDNQVIEVTESKTVVWRMNGIEKTYDSVRLEDATLLQESTGESYDGTVEVNPTVNQKSAVSTVRVALQIVTPVWFDPIDAVIIILGLVTGAVVRSSRVDEIAAHLR